MSDIDDMLRMREEAQKQARTDTDIEQQRAWVKILRILLPEHLAALKTGKEGLGQYLWFESEPGNKVVIWPQSYDSEGSSPILSLFQDGRLGYVTKDGKGFYPHQEAVGNGVRYVDLAELDKGSLRELFDHVTSSTTISHTPDYGCYSRRNWYSGWAVKGRAVTPIPN
jgi:hypothetical protein